MLVWPVSAYGTLSSYAARRNHVRPGGASSASSSSSPAATPRHLQPLNNGLVRSTRLQPLHPDTSSTLAPSPLTDLLFSNPARRPAPPSNSNITWHPSLSRRERNELRRQRGLTLWLTGLSASGKSTVATALEQHLLHLGLAAYRLDGDNVRFGLNKDLGFSERDRNENIRRISEVAKLFADSSAIAITSFISPYRADRDLARQLHRSSSQSGGSNNDDSEDNPSLPFVEVFVDVPLHVAEQRDPKGLYKKARAGEIKDFTGISAPYEEPLRPEITIKTAEKSVEECVAHITQWLREHGYIPA